jgi:hypothetical protein
MPQKENFKIILFFSMVIPTNHVFADGKLISKGMEKMLKNLV